MGGYVCGAGGRGEGCLDKVGVQGVGRRCGGGGNGGITGVVAGSWCGAAGWGIGWWDTCGP